MSSRGEVYRALVESTVAQLMGARVPDVTVVEQQIERGHVVSGNWLGGVTRNTPMPESLVRRLVTQIEPRVKAAFADMSECTLSIRISEGWKPPIIDSVVPDLRIRWRLRRLKEPTLYQHVTGRYATQPLD